MSAKHEPRPVSGYSEGGRASEAAPRASDAEPSPESARLEAAADPSPEETPEPEAPEKHRVVDAGPQTEREAGTQTEREEANHEAQLEHDLEELAAKAEKADEYLELAQRTKADFENYRKRAARETAAAQERGVTKLARELLPAVDNLDRALAAAESVVQAQGADDGDGAAKLVSGIKLVHDDVIAALSRVGIKPFSPEGEPFDPQRHEAVAQQPIEGAEPGTVVEVYQRGYMLGELVIRPARVLVAG